jgi:prepilin-type N-terminal cleavage/methylation domain-containing protein
MSELSLKKRAKTRLAGFTLIEVSIASIISAMVMTGALMFISDYLKGQAAQAKGQALITINTALNQYEAKYATQLAANQAITIPGFGSVANIYSPTPTELSELGMLANSTPVGTYGIKISTTMVGGVPSGLVWITSPFVNNQGGVDQSLAGAAMLAAGGDAGMSTIANPAMIVGADGWTATNPATGTPAGILAMRNGAGSGAYVRLDGSTPMLGSLNMNGNSLLGANTVNAATVNAATVTASGNIAAAGSLTAQNYITAANYVSSNGNIYAGQNISASGNTSGSTLSATANGNDVFFGSSALYSDGWNAVVRTAGGAVYAQNMGGGAVPIVASQLVTPQGNGVQIGSSFYYGDGTNSAIRQNGALYVQNLGGGAADANVNNLYTSGYLYVGGFGSAGSGCGPNGAIGRDADGPLFCVDGIWKRSTGGGATHVTSYGMPGGVDGTWDIGWHNFCALSEYDSYQKTVPEVYPVSAANSTGQVDWNMSTCNTGSGCNGGSFGTTFMCWDFN